MPGVAKIDEARVRVLLAKGCTQTQVAKRLGCSKSVVCRVAKTTSREER